MTSSFEGPVTVLAAATTTFWPGYIFVLMVFAIIVSQIMSFRARKRRRAFIEAYQWPPGLLHSVSREYPSLNPIDLRKIDAGLRQFFLAYLTSGRRHVTMPSVAADELWHNFILHTREYDAFCRKAFGRFLHHRPAAVLRPQEKATNEGLRRVWWQTCRLEGIDPRSPNRLPHLFALDRQLSIPGGFVYQPDCEALRRNGYNGYCGGDFSLTTFDGGTDGMGDGGGDGGGGDGGGGCGGD